MIYTVPIGQNPSGLTTRAHRKKEIYDVCVKYDIIIAEDDPYYILQEGDYVPKAQRVPASTHSEKDEIEAFINTLEPSYLRSACSFHWQAMSYKATDSIIKAV